MTLRHAVLAALMEGEASGYELSKRFDIAVSNFWSATPQQVYRELEKLEVAGLLRGRVVEQQRRPNKRVFTITDSGRAEIHAFIERPARATAIRDDLLVKLQASDDTDLPALVEQLTARLDRSRDKLALYDRLRDALLNGRSDEEFLGVVERVGPYLTLMGGRMYEQRNAEWCLRALEVLDRRGA